MLRHNLLSAGAGAALPDLTLASDGPSWVVATWFTDPSEMTSRRSVRFLGEGRARIGRHHVENAIAVFVAAVLVRLDSVKEAAVERLRRDWHEVQQSMIQERDLCFQVAKMGLDPYDIEDQTAERIEKITASLPSSLTNDLLDSATLDDLALNADYASDGTHRLNDVKGSRCRSPLQFEAGTSVRPHEVGYRLAHEFRRAVSIPNDQGIPDLRALLQEKEMAIELIEHRSSAPTRMKGICGFSRTHASVLITLSSPRVTTSRFLLGRALGACLLGHCNDGPRLLTNSFTWDQAAARAFAAELLAPHEALAKQIGAVVDSDELQVLADTFQVSTQVVERQVQNHRLATVLPD